MGPCMTGVRTVLYVLGWNLSWRLPLRDDSCRTKGLKRQVGSDERGERHQDIEGEKRRRFPNQTMNERIVSIQMWCACITSLPEPPQRHCRINIDKFCIDILDGKLLVDISQEVDKSYT